MLRRVDNCGTRHGGNNKEARSSTYDRVTNRRLLVNTGAEIYFPSNARGSPNQQKHIIAAGWEQHSHTYILPALADGRRQVQVPFNRGAV